MTLDYGNYGIFPIMGISAEAHVRVLAVDVVLHHPLKLPRQGSPFVCLIKGSCKGSLKRSNGLC